VRFGHHALGEEKPFLEENAATDEEKADSTTETPKEEKNDEPLYKRPLVKRVAIAFGVLALLVLVAVLAFTYIVPAAVGGVTTSYRKDLTGWPSPPEPPHVFTSYVSWLTCKKDAGPAFTTAANAKLPDYPSGKTETALLAAGCYWEVELTYQRIPGVLETEVGFAGGTTTSPTYKQVSTDTTGHCETVRVVFDPEAVQYRQLLKVFFEQFDPTTLNRQGNDVGIQYRSAVFYTTEAQRLVAQEEKAVAQQRLGKTVVTEITPAPTFWKAEEYHQQYLQKHGIGARKGDTSAIPCYAF